MTLLKHRLIKAEKFFTENNEIKDNPDFYCLSTEWTVVTHDENDNIIKVERYIAGERVNDTEEDLNKKLDKAKLEDYFPLEEGEAYLYALLLEDQQEMLKATSHIEPNTIIKRDELGQFAEIQDLKGSLKDVATSGSYDDLDDKPDIPEEVDITQDIEEDKESTTKVPSAKAVKEYTEALLDDLGEGLDLEEFAYMQHAAQRFYEEGFGGDFEFAWNEHKKYEPDYSKGIIIPYGRTEIYYNEFNGNEKEEFKTLDVPLVIPDTVTIIGGRAFSNWWVNNKPLIIPGSVTTIGESAFSGWQSNNKQLIIPNSVTMVGKTTFAYWYSNNKQLIIPNSVTTIGDSAFREWTSNNQQLIIGNSVTTIGDSAFREWTSNNQQLIIPDSVTEIGDSAFSRWQSNNKQLIIPDSVTTIGGFAFYNWRANTQQLIIPDSVTTIGDSAFTSWEQVPYIIMQSTTPPFLHVGIWYYETFNNQNNAPIYIPIDSVDAYKTTNGWSQYKDRIVGVTPHQMELLKLGVPLDDRIGDIESALDSILGV